MMAIHFATCNRRDALGFLQKVYPSATVTDTPNCAGPLLDLVEKDILRIQDPMMHAINGCIAIIPATYFKEAQGEEVDAVCREFAARMRAAVEDAAEAVKEGA